MTTETLLQRLQNLSLQSEAKFGILTPQHMVEHLTITVKLSAGRIPIPVFEPNEKQLARKQALLFTDIPFPQGVKAPGLPDTLLELRYPDLETAKAEAMRLTTCCFKKIQRSILLTLGLGCSITRSGNYFMPNTWTTTWVNLVVKKYLTLFYSIVDTPPDTINFITSEFFTPLSGVTLSRFTKNTFPDTL